MFVEWLRHDPWGPEVFGLALDVLLLSILVPLFRVWWTSSQLRKELRLVVSELFARYERLKSALKSLLDLVRSIGQRTAISTKFLFGDEQMNPELELSLTEDEKIEIRNRREDVIAAAASFLEQAERSGYVFEARRIKNNMDESTLIIRQILEAIRTLNYFQRRDSLVDSFADAAHEIKSLLALRLEVGDRKSRAFSDHHL